MVQQTDVEQGQGVFEPARDGLIRQAGFADPGWVVMRYDQGCRIVLSALFLQQPWDRR